MNMQIGKTLRGATAAPRVRTKRAATPAAKPCLGELVAVELDAAIEAHRKLDRPETPQARMDAAQARIDALVEDLSRQRATSIAGAAAQVAIAHGLVDVISATGDDHTDDEQQIKRLLASAFACLRSRGVPMPGIECYYCAGASDRRAAA